MIWLVVVVEEKGFVIIISWFIWKKEIIKNFMKMGKNKFFFYLVSYLQLVINLIMY